MSDTFQKLIFIFIQFNLKILNIKDNIILYRYKLLLKMGWKAGQGIGKAGNEGMVAPVSTLIEANDGALGLGKATQYNAVLDETAFESADKRRRLCEGDATVSLLRATQEAKWEEIAAEKTKELQAFYCEWCCKQYASVPEWEVCLLAKRPDFICYVFSWPGASSKLRPRAHKKYEGSVECPRPTSPAFLLLFFFIHI